MKTKQQLTEEWNKTWNSKLKNGVLDPTMATALALFNIRDLLFDIRELMGGEEKAKHDETMKTTERTDIPSIAPVNWQHSEFKR